MRIHLHIHNRLILLLPIMLSLVLVLTIKLDLLVLIFLLQLLIRARTLTVLLSVLLVNDHIVLARTRCLGGVEAFEDDIGVLGLHEADVDVLHDGAGVGLDDARCCAHRRSLF